MNQQLQDLIHVLDLETLEQNLFRGPSRDLGGKSVFGGTLGGVFAEGFLDGFNKFSFVHGDDGIACGSVLWQAKIQQRNSLPRLEPRGLAAARHPPADGLFTMDVVHGMLRTR